MKNTMIFGLIAILLIPFVSAQICPADEDGRFFGEIVQPDGTILGDYYNDCVIGADDVAAVSLAINGRLACSGTYTYENLEDDYRTVNYNLDINGDGICTEIDKWAISAKSVHCTDGDGDYYYVCINTPTMSHSFGGKKDCDDAKVYPEGGITTTYYLDSDSDNYGNAGSTIEACSQPDKYVTDNTDCNDYNATINPGMAEIGGNGVDEDCNNVDQEVLGTITTSTGYELYHATVDYFVSAIFESSVLSGDSGSTGYYELFSNTVGNAYLKYSKPGFVEQQCSTFSNDIDAATNNIVMQQDDDGAGSVTGIVYDLWTYPAVIAGASLYVQDPIGIIQIVNSDASGNYRVIGLPDSTYTGDVYTITYNLASCCVVYGAGGDGGSQPVSITKGTVETRDLYVDCVTNCAS